MYHSFPHMSKQILWHVIPPMFQEVSHFSYAYFLIAIYHDNIPFLFPQGNSISKTQSTNQALMMMIMKNSQLLYSWTNNHLSKFCNLVMYMPLFWKKVNLFSCEFLLWLTSGLAHRSLQNNPPIFSSSTSLSPDKLIHKKECVAPESAKSACQIIGRPVLKNKCTVNLTQGEIETSVASWNFHLTNWTSPCLLLLRYCFVNNVQYKSLEMADIKQGNITTFATEATN